MGGIGMTEGKTRSVRSIKCLTFFLADVQTGLGPFLAHILRRADGIPTRWDTLSLSEDS
jgi:hypothetical protein